ncbi:MAG TPA: ABC transporter ATP-binding protein [Planctomycetota bacterium]|nr:ABC transporter ATP-binding protein [Planctomycetota bacterium]
MSPPVVFVRGLSKWYGEVIALSDLSFELAPGIAGLLGPNGAGKSTLFRLLTGLLRPSLGEVRLFGEEVEGNPPLFRRVGYCPEADAFWEEMRALEFVRTLARIHGYGAREAKERAGRALERVKLADRGKRRIGGLSHGQRQRLKFAQALLHDPDLLLLDEPFNGMDPVLRRETMELVLSLAAEGKTILVASHVLYEVEALTERILLLLRGHLRAEGSIADIRDLLDEVPRKLVVATPDPRGLAAAAAPRDGVVAVRREKGRVALETDRPEEVLRWITQAAASGEVIVEEVYAADEDLESIFDLLVK